MWLQGELATHVGAYGTWMKGTPQWKGEVRIGLGVIEDKRRRVSAFMKALQNSWLKLEECFRYKYSIKLRRETQRLLLLERRIPVPPTRVLDDGWPAIGGSPYDVCDRLRQLSSEPHGMFVEDLLTRVLAHLTANQIPS